MLILTPAYGRDYKNNKALLEDFNQGKDFIINQMIGPFSQWDTKPINKSDLISEQAKQVQVQVQVQVQFRYQNNRKTFIHKL